MSNAEINTAREKEKAMKTVTSYQIPYGDSKVDLVVEERGEGQLFLLLHGGAGPASVARFAGMLAERQVRVITPTHPGFARTMRPDELKTMRGLAQVYATLLKQLGVTDVTVIGNSMGGCIAAELALLDAPQVSDIVLVDAVGIDVPGHPVTDILETQPRRSNALLLPRPEAVPH